MKLYVEVMGPFSIVLTPGSSLHARSLKEAGKTVRLIEGPDCVIATFKNKNATIIRGKWSFQLFAAKKGSKEIAPFCFDPSQVLEIKQINGEIIWPETI